MGGWREAHERGDICIHIADIHSASRCIAEANIHCEAIIRQQENNKIKNK